MFDAKKEAKNIIDFIQDYYKKNNLGGVVIGISGGKDSAVVAGLFSKAIGGENIIGVTMPCHSNSEDKKDAELVANHFNFKIINLDLTNVFDTFTKEAEKLDDYIISEDANINIKPRLRMTTLYYIAQMYSKLTGKVYIVAGTGNKSEEYVGYFTKGGDSVSDIKVISDLCVDEVIKVGEVIGVPEKVLYKPPSDGLSGKTDEDKLGFTYDDVKKVINNKPLPTDIKEKIIKKHNANKHKFSIPTYKRKEKIGVYVGSFNPVHDGHIHVAKYVLNEGLVDKVLLLPTPNYWDKNDLAPVEDRINMLNYYAEENIVVDTIHNNHEFTYQVLNALQEDYPNAELYLIIGSDNVEKFHLWKNIEQILKHKIIVLNRGDKDIEKTLSKFNSNNFVIIDDFKFIDVSSTEIRQGKTEHIKKEVLDYIKEHKLY